MYKVTYFVYINIKRRNSFISNIYKNKVKIKFKVKYIRETFKDGIMKAQKRDMEMKKMFLGWPETDAKEVLMQQLASNFSRLSLFHPLLSYSLIFVPGGTNLRIKQPLFYV